MGINAVKGVEIGAGMGAAALTGEENSDEMRAGKGGKPEFLSNHAAESSAASPPGSRSSRASRSSRRRRS